MAAAAFDPREYEKAAQAQAAKALARLEREARGAVIALHGRGGLGGLILGSQTARVLAHSKIAVLVIR